MKKRLLLALLLSVVSFLLLRQPTVGGVASANVPEQGTPEPVPTDARFTDDASTDGSSAPTPTALLGGVILTRTPEPTATPDMIEEVVERLSQRIGMDQATLLGLEATAWINLVISLLFVLAGYLVGTWLIRSVLPRIARHTQTEFDDQLLEAIGGDVRWLVVILVLYLGTVRLTFVSVGLKVLLRDVYFVVGLFLTLRIIFKLIDLADEWARQRLMETGREVETEHVTVLLTRLGRIVTAAVGLIVVLNRFGVDVTALTAALGLGGLAITLAAKDTIADMIAGVIILVDRPFRVGDRIEIREARTWGDVTDIGLRTTRIRTRDNRVVILPNSTIGSNLVMNYSYPDPRYRSETHLSVGYDTDLEVARRLIIDTIRGVEGVLTDRPIDALYIEMGSSGIVFRVRWWIETYEELRRNYDRVHTALQAAFDSAGITFAPTTRSVNLKVDPETVQRVSSTFRERGGASPGGKANA